MEMSAKMVVMSHLSDAQEIANPLRLNFVKYIIMETKGNLNQDIDADAMYQTFIELMKKRKGL